MTYTPGINGGRINATISGNTAGAGALMSTGTITLAGGNNITLSQAGNAITISGPNSPSAASQTLGMSNIGNTAGDNAVISGSALRYVFAGGNNITLSQSTNGSSATLTISAASQSVQTQNLHNITLSGNTSGVMAHISSGTLTLAGGNNITLSQNGNAVTISGPTTAAQSNQTLGLFALGNTTQNSSTSLDARSLSFNGLGIITAGYSNGSIQLSASQSSDTNKAGTGFSSAGNNIGLSGTLNTNGLSLSATVPSQSNQNISLYGLGNTAQSSSTLLNASNLSYSGAGNITVALSDGALKISGSQSVQTQSMVSVNGSTGNISFDNASNVKFGFNGSTITASVSQTNQNISLYGLGNTTQNSSTVLNASNLSFNGLGNISVGYSNGSIQVSGSQSTQTQNLHNLTLSGNTAGAMAQVSSGTLTLAGGNNITLSQNGNAVTISAGNAAGDGYNSAQFNGSTANSSMPILWAGSSNGSGNLTFGLTGSTVTGSYAQSNQNISLYGIGNTAQSSSTLLNASNLSYSGAGNITVALSDGALKISGSQSSDTNKAGTGFSSAGNNIGLSGTLNTNGLSLSATVPSQSNQNISLYGLGNTTQNSSTVLNASNLSFNGLGGVSVGYSNGSIQISGGAGGAGDGWNEAQFTNSTANSTQDIVWAGNSNGSGNITMGLTGSTVTASAPSGGGGNTGSYFDNMIQQNSLQALTFTSLSTGLFGRVIVQPLSPANEVFPFAMTASTALLNFSANATATAASSSHSSTFYMGLYTRVNSTQLSLVNSVSSSWGLTADTRNSASYHGARWLSIHSSQWSAEPVLSQDKRYFFAVLFRTSNYSGSNGSSLANSIGGMHYGHSVQRSGFLGSSGTSGTSFNAWHPFMGVHSLTTHTIMPGSIANSEINKASAYANFIPQVIFNGGGGVIN